MNIIGALFPRKIREKYQLRCVFLNRKTAFPFLSEIINTHVLVKSAKRIYGTL